ncbi:DUF3040 domain-containing protein [Nonomuraea sp. NPDC048916]|uniref:DUF3040 domain-containing protein n=1 Tax=Nonomuraea sp. NPDC048916 TaxID=3154232 RepID=UPI0033F23AFD
MALSAREQQALDAIARRLRAEEPALAESLTELATGRTSVERGPSKPEGWPIALIAISLAVLSLALLYALSGSPEPMAMPAIR